MADPLRLKAKCQFSARHACYHCGRSGVRVTKDHGAPQRWVYPPEARPPQWPTLPLCRACERATEEAERELNRYTIVRGPPTSTPWATFLRGVRERPEVRGEAISRTGGVGVIQRDGKVSIHPAMAVDPALLQVALVKLARALEWIRTGEALEQGRSFVLRAGPPDLVVTRALAPAWWAAAEWKAYSFGRNFEARFGQVEKLPTVHAWHVIYFSEVHYTLVSSPDPNPRVIWLPTDEPRLARP